MEKSFGWERSHRCRLVRQNSGLLHGIAVFQEGTLHLKLDEMVFGQKTDEVKELIMQKCASLFDNVKKAKGIFCN